MNAKTSKSSKAKPASKPAPCVCEQLGPLLADLLQHFGPPDPARRHFETARLEFLKGVRAILDARIEHVSKPRRTAKGEKINVG